MPDGIATFPGIDQIVDAQYTRAHGIQPGVATISIAPQANIVGDIGDLVFTFAGTSQNGNNTYTFSDCKLDRMNFELTTNGFIMRIAVFDRRWKWDFPTITGSYNMRHENGELVTDLSTTQSQQTANLIWQTEKTPQELASLCLDAMGESGYDVSALPNNSRPLVEWDWVNAARALEDLCESLGCRVVLKMDDTVEICQVGVGAPLPDNLDIRMRSPGIDLPERPDALRVICGRSRFQADLLLEDVGLDVDGQVKPTSQLSYIPKTNGSADLGKLDPPFYLAITDLKARELAKQTIYRWYRVKVPFTLVIADNQSPDQDPVFTPLIVTNRLMITPLEDMQVDQEVENGEKRFKNAWVWGVWATQSLGYVNGVTTVKTINPNIFVGELQVSQPPLGSELDYAKKSLYMGGFSLDKDRCIVKFSDIVAYCGTKTDSSNNTYQPMSAATLVLRTALCIRNPSTRAWLRANKRRDYGTAFGTKPKDIKHDDVILNIANRYDPTFSYDPSTGSTPIYANISTFDSNASDVQQACNYYLDAAEQNYLGAAPEIRTYTGFQAVDLDGAIQQVTFAISRGGATTTIARNTEIIANRMPYNERRFYARMRQLQEKAPKSEQQQDRDAKRRWPI